MTRSHADITSDQPSDSERSRPALWPARRGLRVAWHRATLRHLGSAYPLQIDQTPARGPYLGVNVTGGMTAFHFDPFEFYDAGILSGPNCLIWGEVGSGKSATVKAFLRRSLAHYGPGRRRVIVLDPKGEYTGPFADAHGLATVRLRPGGGGDRLNPMAAPTARTSRDDADGAGEGSHAREALAAALIATVLGRPLDATEDALVGSAVAALARTRASFTLHDLIDAVATPSAELVALSRRSPDDLTTAATPLLFALDRLVNRTLAGMFDGDTTVSPDWETGPGLVIDLSAVYSDPDALPLVMLAATSWITSLFTRGDRRTIQVVDEAWAAVAHGARHFQSSLKLARSYGVSTWLVCHRPSDLSAQNDDGTSAAKIAAGLLSDIQTRIVLRQAPNQVDPTAQLLGLTSREAAWIGQLVPGRALWRMQDRAAVCQLVLTATERRLFDTDGAMSA